MGGVHDRWLMLHNAYLAKHGQQSLQGLRIAPANPLLPTAKAQKSIHGLAVQSLDSNLFLLQPSAEIGDYDDLLLYWAQTVGEVLPLTHFLRIVRGILLKGNGMAQVATHLWPIALFTAVVLTIGVKRYRQTLD